MSAQFKAEDLKQLQTLVSILKRAHFKDLTGPEVLTVALGIQWVSELKGKIETAIASVKPQPLPTPGAYEPPKGVKKGKK